jgi:preprotein translocase subunit SecA
MRLFASDRIVSIMDRLGMEEGEAIEHPWVTRAIEVAQKRVENFNFEIRKQLLEYDNVMNKQREAVYNLRRSILDGENLKDRVLQAMEDAVHAAVRQYLFSGQEGAEPDLEGLAVYLKSKFDYDITPRREEIKDLDMEKTVDVIDEDLTAAYEQKEKDVSPEQLRQLEKIFLLNTIDTRWKEHLYAMDQLKEGVGLRSYAQRDPLLEYKKEGFAMFQMMYESISQEVAEIMFKIRPLPPPASPAGAGQPAPILPRSVFSSLPQRLIHNNFSGLSKAASSTAPRAEQPPPAAPEETHSEPYHKTGPKVGRNDPCPCGSGKKYKKCCGA